MRLWIVSDPHMEMRSLWPMPPALPDFDVLVVAGDVWNGEIERSIAMVAALAAGKPAVFVGGNHEWWHRSIEETLKRGYAAAREYGVYWLEIDTCEIGGVRFAGATLWTPDDVRFLPSMRALAQSNADVVVTHYQPPPRFLDLCRPRLWVYGHHHGFSDRTMGGTRWIRNAIGFPGEDPAAEGEQLARLDYVVEIDGGAG
jgi:predicted MPP superfamily phosphohydrolase